MRGRKVIKLLLALMIAALIGVTAVIALRQMEYKESRDYYDSLRTGSLPGATGAFGGNRV